jgi:hypothetical protein
MSDTTAPQALVAAQAAAEDEELARLARELGVTTEELHSAIEEAGRVHPPVQLSEH